MTPSRLPPAFLNHFFACANEVVAGESLIALADFRFFVANFSSAIRRSLSGTFRSDLAASVSSRSKTMKVAGWAAANFCTLLAAGWRRSCNSSKEKRPPTLQINVLATPKSEAAKAIPFRFILPAAGWNLVDRLCFHWRQ